jgi:hypothetical protein
MNLTPSQLQTLAAAIAAETDAGFVINRTAGATGAMADFFNAASTNIVWKSTTTVDDIFNNVTWANLTPTDAPDTTQQWMNRALMCQSKQFNLQTMLSGRQSLRTNNNTVRAGLQDCLTNLPSGTAGALITGGWPNVKLAIQRPATKGEALFIVGAGTTSTPVDLVLEGQITNDNIVAAINL